MNSTQIRKATPEDVRAILQLIKELAIYEKMEQDAVATVEQMHHALFVEQSAQCILTSEGEMAIGFALYFFNFSTFLGKKGLYLEDLYVKPDYRGKGYGKAMLLHLKEIAIQENCGRMEWSVLDWNVPAIEFYKSLGAKAMNGWTVFRMENVGESLCHLLKKLDTFWTNKM